MYSMRRTLHVPPDARADASAAAVLPTPLLLPAGSGGGEPSSPGGAQRDEALPRSSAPTIHARERREGSSEAPPPPSSLMSVRRRATGSGFGSGSRSDGGGEGGAPHTRRRSSPGGRTTLPLPVVAAPIPIPSPLSPPSPSRAYVDGSSPLTPRPYSPPIERESGVGGAGAGGGSSSRDAPLSLVHPTAPTQAKARRRRTSTPPPAPSLLERCAPRTPPRSVAASCLHLSVSSRGRRGRVVDSPLLGSPPTIPLPPTAAEAGLDTHEGRWSAMSELAGPHRQDPTVLDLTGRSVPPGAIEFGVTPGAARAVEDLRFDGDTVLGRHELPEFLDLVSRVFPNLKHVRLGGSGSGRTREQDATTARGDGGTTTQPDHSAGRTKDGGGSGEGADDRLPVKVVDPIVGRKLGAAALAAAAERETARMRRLYILYRLPNLLSVDGIPVTAEERRLARPASPAGCRVRKDDWLTGAMASASDGNGGGGSGSGSGSHYRDGGGGPHDADGGSLSSSSCERDDVESATGSAVEVSFCGLISYVRTPKRPGTTTTSTRDGGHCRDAGSAQKEGRPRRRSGVSSGTMKRNILGSEAAQLLPVKQQPSLAPLDETEKLQLHSPKSNEVPWPPPLQNEPLVWAPASGAKEVGHTFQGEKDKHERSTVRAESAQTDDGAPSMTDTKATPLQQQPQKSTIDSAEAHKRPPDLPEVQTSKGISDVPRQSKKKRGSIRGSRPPPSPASKLRTFPVLKGRRSRSGSGKRPSARKLWRQRSKAASTTSMLDQEVEEEEREEEEGGTDEDDSASDDPDATPKGWTHQGGAVGTKEILSSFLVDVKETDSGVGL